MSRDNKMKKVSTTNIIVKRGKLAHLKPVLQQWIKIMNQYQSKTENDAIWWYNERASLSSFAGAVWKSGGIAIEEASNPKKSRRRRSKKRRWGRADLSVEHNDSWYALEAKQVWVSVNSSAAVNQIKAALSRAKGDVQRVHPYDAQRVAAVFISPWVPQSQKEDIVPLINNFISRLKEEVNYDALATVFPRSGRKLYWKPDRCYYPGTVLLLRVPRR